MRMSDTNQEKQDVRDVGQGANLEGVDESGAVGDGACRESDQRDAGSPILREKIRAREQFFARLRNDWAMPAINDQVQGNARRSKPSPQIDLRIALVGSDRLAVALGDIGRILRLDAEHWNRQIEEFRPSFVLVEADWLNAGDPWRNRLIGPETGQFLQGFVDTCRAHDVPTAFWFNQDREHIHVFRQAFEPFDYIFANALCAANVQAIRPDAIPLPNFVDVGCFNPYKHKEGNWKGLPRLMPVLMARAYQYMQVRAENGLSERIAELFDQKFWLYEDRYSVRNNNQRMDPVERSRFLGCFYGEERAALMKTAVAEVFPSELYPSSSPQAERHFLECMATKTIPVFDDPVWENRLLEGGGAALQASVFKAQITNIAAHRLNTAVDAHLNWRSVMANNTYFEFIEALCHAMNIQITYSVPKDARISFIMPTVRPALIPMAIKFYKAQKYKNRELIIVLNSNDFEHSSIDRMRGRDESIHIHYAPSDMPVGCAVNLGISHMTGDYWAKMDDDDYYSPNYLSDINLYRKFLDFDIAGKGALFNYLEEQDQTILRSSSLWDRETHNFAGGTLIVKNEPDNVHWPERVRGFADIEFLTGRLVEGAHIASLDPFGHIQIRRKDSRFHTWTRQASHMTADYTADGLNIESVFI